MKFAHTFSLNLQHRLLLAWGIALIATLILSVLDIGRQIEDNLANIRNELLEKPASGQLVLIEIDAKSLQALHRWPLPRAHYTDAIERLNAAGVSAIAFDIDFSARSNAADDQRLAEALARSKAAVILPTFRQSASQSSTEMIENFPLPELREHALLASINVYQDRNGQINHYSYGIKTSGIPRPSIASHLNASAARVDTQFPINQAIDPASIPRISLIELLNAPPGTFALEGKKVLIGTTALEEGDRYATRRFGTIPGVVIQALATETLIQDSVVLELNGLVPLGLAALVMLMMLWKRGDTHLAVLALVIGVSSFLLLLVLEHAAIATYSNVPLLAFLGIFLALRKFFETSLNLELTQLQNPLSQLPNRLALRKDVDEEDERTIVVARLRNWRDVHGLVDEQETVILFQNIMQRVSLLALEGRVYHLDADTLAWIIGPEYLDEIEHHCDTAAALFQAPFLAGEKKFRLNPTFGLALNSDEEATVAADQALTKNRIWCWYDNEASSQTSIEQRLLVEIDGAIEKGELWNAYQPKWDLREGRLQGVEALIRWQHRELGNVRPDHFIPVLEREGRVAELTFFVLQSALNDLSRWIITDPHITCSVNISAPLLSDSKFVEQLIAAVEASDIDPSNMIFEVTESATMADTQMAVLALERIREAKIKISIDDYGTGQSTLSYLQKLPADEIKIDQSFIKDIVSSNSNQVLVHSTIQMARALGLKVVAEGVEDTATMQLLKRLDCDVIQGWHIAKPMSASDLEEQWIGTVPHNLRLAG